MRIRCKPWAKPELEACPFYISDPKACKGQWQAQFPKTQPLRLELGCGKGGFIAQEAPANPEYNYIEEVPLHESQQKVKESKDGMYREYTLTVRPSRDFLQELLWHGRNIIVLKPENLRQEMIDILKDMTKSYETGECLNGEE